MKRYLPLTILSLGLVYLSTTGFQCGSADLTSGNLYFSQQQYVKAEDAYLKVVQKEPNNEEAWYKLGRTRYEMKKYPEMNDAFTKALSISDAHKTDISSIRLGLWALNYNEGVKFYNRGRDTAAFYDSALTCFKTSMVMAPDSVNTYYVTALTYYAKKNFEDAEATLETALQKKKNFVDAANLLGQIHTQMGMDRRDAKDNAGATKEFTAAADAFKLAYDANPTDPEVILNLAESYERSGQEEKALSLTREAVAKNPNDKQLRYANGVFLLKKDQFAEAIEQFQKAVDLDPTYTDAIYNLGAANLNWGIALRDEAVKKAESTKGAKLDQSFKEKFKTALPYLEKSAQLRSNDAVLWQQLGKLYTILNQPDKAKSAFERADNLAKSK